MSTTGGAVLAHGQVNRQGKVQVIHGQSLCATMTTTHVDIEDTYVIAGCSTCGTVTVFASNLDAQKGVVALP